MPPRVDELIIKNLRSVSSDPVTLTFPTEGPLVLLGENNSGKSNITKALSILFGEVWPGSHTLEEHDFHGRDSDGIDVDIVATVSGVTCTYCRQGEVHNFRWKYDLQNRRGSGSPVTYVFSCTNGACNKSWPNNEMRGTLSAAVLDADRRLDYQLSYTSKWTMLSKLMRKFHQRLLEDDTRKERLAGIFRDLLSEFEGVPEFARFQQLLATTAEDLGQNLPYRLDVDFSAYDPSNFFRSLRIHPKLEGEIRSFDELGTGQSQVLALAFALAYSQAYGEAEGLVLVIDEPESNLHPLAQQWLANRIRALAAPGLQVVVTTHSPHFIDLSRPQNLAMVRKANDGATTVTQLSLDEFQQHLVRRGADPSKTTSDSIGPFYEAGATTEIVSGLFARRCVLVEGPTEALALPSLLKNWGFDLLREGVAIVPVGGVGNIAKWYRFYHALGVDCYCIFDSDSDKSGRQADERRRNREDVAQALGLSEGDPAEGRQGEGLHSNGDFAVLGPNFEGAMTSLFGASWNGFYDESRSYVGTAKHLRARFAAQHMNPARASGETNEMLRSFGQNLLGVTLAHSAGGLEDGFGLGWAPPHASPSADSPPF